MNPRLLLLLLVSLGANIVLVLAAMQDSKGAYIFGPRKEPSPNPVAQQALTNVESQASRSHIEWSATKLDWPLESTDHAAYRDRLREAGIPEVYVRALVWNRIGRQFKGRRDAFMGGASPPPFWVVADSAEETARQDGLRDLDREQRDLFKTVFDEGYGDEARLRYQRERLTFLSAEKAEVVARIAADYDELRARIRRDMFSMGTILPEDQEKLALLEKERQADIAAVLAPEEIELYDLHTSQTANSLRARLGYFEPTEEEFRAIFALQRTYDEQYSPSFMRPSPEMMRQRSEASGELRKQIESVLGPERYADYERATDFSYLSARKIVEHFGLPQENAATVHSMRADFMRRAGEIRRTTASQPRAEQSAALSALLREAEARLTELLGTEGAAAFRQAGGSWMSSLERQASSGRGVSP